MSDEEQIPASVRELIRARIHSIEALEVVMALRERAGRAVSPAQLSTDLRLGPSSVEQALDALEQADLVAKDEAGNYGYAPTDEALDAVVAELARTYQELRVETLVFISKSALGRVRDGALRTFAEAFRLRGKK